MNVFLELPVEITCDIVGNWLFLEDITRLDNAYCNAQQRTIFIESILQSQQSCLADSPFRVWSSMSTKGLEWVAAKRIRTEVVPLSRYTNLTTWEQHLKLLGQHVKCVHFESMYNETEAAAAIVSNYCTNLASLIWTESDWSDTLIQLLTVCTKLTSLQIQCSDVNDDSLSILERVPPCHHLRLKGLDMNCPHAAEETLLKICTPESVQKLRLSHIDFPDWSRFANLRSLGFHSYLMPEDEQCVLQILQRCPSIIHLDLSNNMLLTDDVVAKVARAAHQLRSLNIEYSEHVTDLALAEITKYHKTSLEALYVKSCVQISAAGVNRVLAECPHLRTLSCDSLEDTDYALMDNLTALLTGCPVWSALHEHCRNLQQLHVVFNHDDDLEIDSVVAAVCSLSKLRTLYVIDMRDIHFMDLAYQVSLRRPTICVTDREDESEWYNLFDMPI